MSFSGQSNPPWQRNNVLVGGASVGQLSSGGLSFHQTPTAQMFLQQQQQSLGFNHGSLHSANAIGGGGSAMYQQSGSGGGGGNTISYPQNRAGLNPVAFQHSPNSGHIQAQSQNRTQHQQHYNSIGTVTKISAECGLVNEEVFFYRNVCKGQIPKLGDRVLFEATFNPNGQYKWNATRIQMMPQSGMNSSNQPPPLMGSSVGGKIGSGYSAVPPPSEYQRAQQRKSSPRRLSPSSRDRHQPRIERDRRDRERNPRLRDSDDEEIERKRRREETDRSKDRARAVVSRSDRDRERDREREHDQIIMERRKALAERERERERERKKERESEKERERSPLHRSAIKSRRPRVIRRYMVQIPKTVLTIKQADVQELKLRYSTMYIPSDFFHAEIKWSDAFTLENPFSLHRPCQFHIMHKIVEPLMPDGDQDIMSIEQAEPDDVNYLYSAKVMLLSCPPIAEIYEKCFEVTDESEQHTMHPSRLISFLVGTRGRNEPMAIGGPWSPSLDGENPDKDPAVLIRTAIRTCKALTGIDLSNCTQWYRFVELYYHRNDHKNKDQEGSARIETVVIYLPDIHSCVPTANVWESLTRGYKTAVENLISRKAAISKSSSSSAETTTLANDFNNNGENTTAVAINNNAVEQTDEDNDTVPPKADATSTNRAGVAAQDNNTQETIVEDEVDDDDDDALKPTHFSLLDLKTMKVQELRNELMARNLPPKGVRNLLMARLAKAINNEKAEEEAIAAAAAAAEAEAEADEVIEAVNELEEIINCDSDDDQDITEVITDADTKGAEEEEEEEGEEIGKPEDADDEHEDWADVDMNDIVILDEYDSRKNPDDATPKEFDEKEKTQLIRRYTLPNSPHVIVHPSKTAKSGKFDCTIMSLSVLLDYRLEDTKERFFEVSLFAELFNEMLIRDFGFNIYKALYLHKENEAPEAPEISIIADEHKKDESNSNDGEHQQQQQQRSTKDNNSPITDSNENQSNGAAQKSKERRISKHSIDANLAEDDNHSDRKRKNADKSSVADKKMIIAKPQLLLSFVYFDTTQCGYIFEKDLEDLFCILGLNLSRGQIRRVLGKSASRHAFYYRKLTDKEDSAEAPPGIDIEDDDISAEEIRRIALGNKEFYSIFKNAISDNSMDSSDGLFTHNGVVVHVGKLMEKIKRTEKNYSDLDKIYNDLRKQNTELQKEHSKSSGKIKDLQSEIRNLNRRISDTDQDLYAINRKYKDQHATLSYIYHKVAPHFTRDKDLKPENTRDKDHEKSKDKDNEKSKDKDNEKSKDKDNEKSKDKDNDKSKDKDNEKSKDKDNEKSKDKDNEKSKDKDNEKSKDNDNEKPKNKDNEKSKDKDNEKPKVKDNEKSKDKDNEKSKDTGDKTSKEYKDKDKPQTTQDENKEKKTTSENPKKIDGSQRTPRSGDGDAKPKEPSKKTALVSVKE